MKIDIKNYKDLKAFACLKGIKLEKELPNMLGYKSRWGLKMAMENPNTRKKVLQKIKEVFWKYFFIYVIAILQNKKGVGRMGKEELYRLAHNLWKSRTLIERAYDLTLKTIEDEKNMPFLEVALNEIAIGMMANLKKLVDEKN